MKYNSNESMKFLNDYIQKIEYSLREKIESQTDGKFNTNSGEYEIFYLQF